MTQQLFDTYGIGDRRSRTLFFSPILLIPPNLYPLSQLLFSGSKNSYDKGRGAGEAGKGVTIIK